VPQPSVLSAEEGRGGGINMFSEGKKVLTEGRLASIFLEN